MPAAPATSRARKSREHRKESKALVVATSVLQLALVVLVWLLALVPVAVMALVAVGIGALKSGNASSDAPRNAKAPTPVDS
jgi:hypothetical protein